MLKKIFKTLIKKEIAVMLFTLTALILLSGCSDQKLNHADIASMMTNLSENLPPIQKMVVGIAYLIGIFLFYTGLLKLKLFGEARVMMSNNAQLVGPLLKIGLGLLLIMMPSFLNVTAYSLWNGGFTNVDSISGSVIFSGTSLDVEKAVLKVVVVLGYIAFVRGVLILKAASQQGAQHGLFGKGMIHLLGGILSINIMGIINIIKNTVGI